MQTSHISSSPMLRSIARPVAGLFLLVALACAPAEKENWKSSSRLWLYANERYADK